MFPRIPSRPRPLLILALALASVAARGDAPPAHRGMLRSGELRTMPIYDPWYANQELNYSLVGGRYVVVDGDLVLGTEMEVLARSWACRPDRKSDRRGQDPGRHAVHRLPRTAAPGEG